MEASLVGMSRREQELVSSCGNWAGYCRYPAKKGPQESYPPPCTVKDFRNRQSVVAEEGRFLAEMERYYACDPGVSNFPEEFLVVEGLSGLHLATRVPIGDVPYSLEGHPTLALVEPTPGWS